MIPYEEDGAGKSDNLGNSHQPRVADPNTDSLLSFMSETDDEDDAVVVQTSHVEKGWLGSASEKLKKASTMLSNLRPGRTHLKERMWSTWNNVKYSGKWMSDRTGDYAKQGQIVLLGRCYAPEGTDGLMGSGFTDFIIDYYSKIWMTYRTNMSPFVDSQQTSDCGWGCMLRTTQMLVAQGLVINRLDRGWRFRARKPSVLKYFAEEQHVVDDSNDDLYRHRHVMSDMEIIRLFEDCPSAPLGIHRLVQFAHDDIGAAAIGRWFAPSEAISLMRRALRESSSPLTSEMSVLLSVDGRLLAGDAERISDDWTKKLLVFITLRLGTNTVNKVYYNHLRQLFSIPSCLGILGGRPDHSLYFIGYYGNQVIYLDPHVAHEYHPLPTDANIMNGEKPTGAEDESGRRHHPLSSFHCKLLSKMPLSEMDPSCAVGFLMTSRSEFDETIKTLNLNQVVDVDLGAGEGSKRTRDPLFTVVYGDDSNDVRDHHSSGTTDEERAKALEYGFELL